LLLHLLLLLVVLLVLILILLLRVIWLCVRRHTKLLLLGVLLVLWLRR
jgi:hypothetical protein